MKELVFCIVLCLVNPAIQAQEPFSWPENRKAAIVLTYDDGLVSQLDNAIPQLNQYGLKGTFFLDGSMSEDELDRWRVVGLNDHELGNHTLYHPCPEKVLKAHPRFTSEHYDLNSILQEIQMMNILLYGIDGKKSRTYAYPCSETVVGKVDYTNSLQKSLLISYARIGGDQGSVIIQPETLDPFKVPAWGVTNNPDGKELISFVKSVQEEGGLGVFMFHGIGGDYLEVSVEAHKMLLQYLSSQSEVWVETFQEIMNYVKNFDLKENE